MTPICAILNIAPASISRLKIIMYDSPPSLVGLTPQPVC